MIKTKCLRDPKVDSPEWRAGHDEKERDMPQIIVTADRGAGLGEGAVTLRERVNAADFKSQHFARQLVERLGWAVEDAADRAESSPAPEERRQGVSDRRCKASDVREDVPEEPSAQVAEKVLV
jgi:hypothetical protein